MDVYCYWTYNGWPSYDQPGHVATVTSSLSEQDPYEAVKTSDNVSSFDSERQEFASSKFQSGSVF